MTCRDLQPGRDFNVILNDGTLSLRFTFHEIIPGTTRVADIARCTAHTKRGRHETHMTADTRIQPIEAELPLPTL